MSTSALAMQRPHMLYPRLALCAVCFMVVASGLSCSCRDDKSHGSIGGQELNDTVSDPKLLRGLLDAGLPGFHRTVDFLRSSRQDSYSGLYTRVDVLKSFYVQYSWHPYEYANELQVISAVLKDLLKAHDTLRKTAVLQHVRGYPPWGTTEVRLLVLDLCPDPEVGLMARTYCHEVFEDSLQLDVAYSDAGSCGGTLKFPWRTVRDFYVEVLQLRSGMIDPITRGAALDVPAANEADIREKYRKLIRERGNEAVDRGQ